jgi:hypothetical protein
LRTIAVRTSERTSRIVPADVTTRTLKRSSARPAIGMKRP